jgi:phage repressor protein C with HTH and peptisase S24 domain
MRQGDKVDKSSAPEHAREGLTSRAEVNQSIADRLRALQGDQRPAEFARKCGIRESLMRKYLAGSIPGADKLAQIARANGVTIDWLASGEEPRQRSAFSQIGLARDAVVQFRCRRSTVPEGKIPELMQLAFESQLDVEGLEREVGGLYPASGLTAMQPRAGYSYVPLLDVRAAAGKGAVVEADGLIDVLGFREDWIRHELHTAPDKLRLIYVEGDSMEPDLHAGDIVLIDHTDRTARSDGVYVLRMGDALLMKILQRLPGGVIKVSSRNESYEPFSLKADELDTSIEIAIVGRVVWVCRRV